MVNKFGSLAPIANDVFSTIGGHKFGGMVWYCHTYNIMYTCTWEKIGGLNTYLYMWLESVTLLGLDGGHPVPKADSR